MKQVENIKYCERWKDHLCTPATQSHHKNLADEVQNLLCMMHDHPFNQEELQTPNKPPCVVLYTEEQTEDFKNMCLIHRNIMGVDRTFNIGPCFVTLIVFKHSNLLRKST